MKKVVLILLMSLTAGCCEIFNGGYNCVKVEDLKGFGEYQDTKNFRIDGYYYKLSEDNRFDWRIFYQNGIIEADGGIYVRNNSKERNNNDGRIYLDSIPSLIDLDPILQNMGYTFHWGSYHIKDSILTRYWYNYAYAFIRDVFPVECIILNDTTYVENNYLRNLSGDKKIRPGSHRLDTFRFIQSDYKPDSVNFLMKYDYLKEKMKNYKVKE